MKKICLLLMSMLLFIGLIGCVQDSFVGELESRIIALEEALAEMESIQVDMENELMDLRGQIASFSTSITSAQTTISQMQSAISSLQGEIGGTESINIFLPSEYYLVPGDTFQLYYRSIIQAVDPYGYYIRLTGTVGHMYNRYYEWTPTASDNGKSFTLTIEVRDDNGNVFGTATTKLVVSSATTGATRRILCVGDSLTANGYWVSHGYQKYTAAGGAPIELLGTITSGYQIQVKHEGRGGWQWSSFVAGYGATLSPFQNANGTFSFADYATRNGYSGIDELYVLLTWNGVGGTFRTFNYFSEPMFSAKIFIDKFHNEFPDAVVTVMGIPQPSVHAGLGAYYTINQSYGNNYGQFVTALNYNQFLKTWAESDNYKDFMRYVDVKGQFDSEYNMPTVSKPVNTQSSTTELVGTSMGMHPNTAGYLQIGDAFYRALCHEWE